MYLERVELTNVRRFGHLGWQLDADTPRAGWHVILGDNGSGKTTFLRAVTLALIGAWEAPATRVNARNFILNDRDRAEIELRLSADPAWDRRVDGQDAIPQAGIARCLVMRQMSGRGSSYTSPKDKDDDAITSPEGWFFAAFGSFRRFTGGSVNNREVFTGFPRLESCLSIFGEDVAFSDIAEWLGLLRFKELEAQASKSAGTSEGSLLERIRTLVNQRGFLPFDARLDRVSSDEITFLDGNGVEVPLLELSDGYRSVLCLTFELVRLMVAKYGAERLFSADGMQIVAPGVVLIDEVDAHLHPNWQRDIGPWLCRLFPNLQFLVTTHSPFVCQQAIHGSIWRLPAPGTDAEFRRVRGEERTRLVYGDASIALESAAIGLTHNRSDAATALLDELAALNIRSRRGQLSPVEQQRRQALEDQMRPVLPE